MFATRPDGTLVRDVPPYRRIMPYIMKGKAESTVYFTQEIDVTETLRFIERWNAADGDRRITPFHIAVWAIVRTLDARPMLNRFIAGGRTWNRDGVWITFAAKKRMDDDAPLVTIKHRFEPTWSLSQTVDALLGDIKVGRSDEESYTDKELDILLRLPGPLLRLGVKLLRGIDAIGKLPKDFIDGDPMYSSVFMANMGSLKMDSVHHHLYEWGNCPIFAVVGRVKDVPKVEAGQVTTRTVIEMRYTYDERVADGLYAQKSMEYLRGIIEDPAAAGAELPTSAVPAPGSPPHPPVDARP